MALSWCRAPCDAGTHRRCAALPACPACCACFPTLKLVAVLLRRTHAGRCVAHAAQLFPRLLSPHRCAKVLDKRVARLCVLASNCDVDAYKKLVKALCESNNIPIIEVDTHQKLGEWCGLCKLDSEGKARKVCCRLLIWACRCCVSVTTGAGTPAREGRFPPRHCLAWCPQFRVRRPHNLACLLLVMCTPSGCQVLRRGRHRLR